VIVLRRRKIQTRFRELSVAVAAALSLAGCGSGADHRAAAPPPPRLPRALAAALAAQSDAIAQALEAGDPCRASSLARVLQAHTIAAINARRIAAGLQEPLAGAVTDLATRIQCTPPPDQEQGHGKKKGKHKHEGND
jgi:hypothetical protein